MKYHIPVVCIVLFLFLMGTPLYSQPETLLPQSTMALSSLGDNTADSNRVLSDTHRYFGWLQCGAGASTQGYVAARIGVVGCMDEHLLMLRAAGGGELSIFSPPKNDHEEYGILYGRRYSHEFFTAYLSAGPGYTSIKRDGVVYHTAALMIEGNASINIRYVGIGLTAFLNLNPRLVYGGFAVEVQLGYIW